MFVQTFKFILLLTSYIITEAAAVVKLKDKTRISLFENTSPPVPKGQSHVPILMVS